MVIDNPPGMGGGRQTIEYKYAKGSLPDRLRGKIFDPVT